MKKEKKKRIMGKHVWKKVLVFGVTGIITMLSLVGTITAVPFIWITETVDSTGNVGEHTSLALDTNNFPHISYYDNTWDDLKYAYKDGMGWHTETVDSASSVGLYTSIALDANNYPHISYGDATSSDTKYAFKNVTGWHTETVDTGTVGVSTSIALDINGYPHISYYDYINRDLWYAFKDGGGWHTEMVDWTGYAGLDTSIALDTNGYPHISHYDASLRNLKYSYKDAGGWHNVTVDWTGDVGQYTSLALDTNNYPHISHYDNGNGDLKYAYKDAWGWHNVTVDSTGSVGRYTSIALDLAGYVHISYWDSANNDLKYAVYKMDNDWNYWSNPPHMWAIPLGNIGIGTTNPDANFKMEIQGNPKGLYVKTDDNTYESIVGQCHHQYRPAGFVLENRYPVSGGFPKGVMMRFKGMDTNGVMQEYLAFIAEFVTKTAGAIDGDCWIRPVKNNAANWAFRFTHDGKLLIKDGGSASDVPESALHVVGAINLDPIPAPASPTTGFIIYCDQADGDLKAKSDTGVITTLATD